MAVRIISASGGAFSVTSTWVGGVVPTAADSILGDATSGSLALNGNRSVLFVDFTDYAATFSWTGAHRLTLTGAGSTSTFSAIMSFTGYSNFVEAQIYPSANMTFVQLGTQIIGNIGLQSGGSVLTLGSDLYVNDLQSSTNMQVTGNKNIYIYRDGRRPPGQTPRGTYRGNCVFNFVGSGFIENIFGDTTLTASVVIDGDYTGGNSFPPTLSSGSVLYHKSSVNFPLQLQARTIGGDSTFFLKTDNPIPYLFIETRAQSIGTQSFIRSLNPTLNVNKIMPYTTPSAFLGANYAQDWIFLDGGLSASEFSFYPTYEIRSSSGGIRTYAPNVKFDAGFTHSINNLSLYGSNIGATFSSNLVGTQAIIQIATTTSTSDYINFTDINIIGETLYAWNSTLNNTSGILNTLPSGGGGQFGFASIN
jgi:hypothetical protein